jgi:hypothetical protein
VRRVFSSSRELARIVYRDPEHVSERLTLYSIARLADASVEWVEAMRSTRPDTPPAEVAEELRIHTASTLAISRGRGGWFWGDARAVGWGCVRV